MNLSLTAWLDSYRQDLKTALHRAAGDGFRLAQPNATRDELDPRGFGGSARRHLRRTLQNLGLAFDAVGAEYPGAGLAEPALAERHLEHLRGTLELCRDLGVPRVVTNLTGLGEDARRPLAVELLRAVADLSDRSGVSVAVRSVGDDAALLAEQVRETGCPSLRVAVDTARLRPTSANAAAFVDLVGAVGLRDVRELDGRMIEEVDFGQGTTDFPAFFAWLEQCGYDGTLAIRRDAADAGVDALRQGREHIASLLR